MEHPAFQLLRRLGPKQFLSGLGASLLALTLLGSTWFTGGGGGGTSYPPLDFTTTAWIHEEFMSGDDSQGSIGELGWEFSAAGGTLTNSNGEENHPGLLSLATGATTGNAIYPFIGSGTALDIDGDDDFDCRWIARLNTGTANTTYRIGLADDLGEPGLSNGAFFEKETADTNWFRVTESGGTQTRTDTGIAVSGNFDRFRVRRIDASTIGFTINANTEQTLATNLPTVAIEPGLYLQTNANDNKTVDFDYFDCQVTLAR